MWTESNLLTNLLATIGDPEGTRTVTSIVALLVALGLALTMVAVWLYRTTRPDPELLAPLEVMGERKWRRADPVAQRRTLDAVRPEGAEPLTPSAAPPLIDEAFDAGPAAAGFDDLGEDDADLGRGDQPERPDRPPNWPPVGEVTPQQIDRPEVDRFDDVFSHDIDPEVLAAAEAELEAELHRAAELDGEHVDEFGAERPVEVRSEADAD